MTQQIRNMMSEHQAFTKDMTNVAIENHKLLQKQVVLAMENTRASLEMARDLGQSSAKMWTDAMFPAKTEA